MSKSKRRVLFAVNVLGREVKVVLTDDDKELVMGNGRKVRAFFEPDAHLIVIDSREPVHAQAYLYRHELGHAVLTYSGVADEMTYPQEERMIDRTIVPYVDILDRYPYPVKS